MSENFPEGDLQKCQKINRSKNFEKTHLLTFLDSFFEVFDHEAIFGLFLKKSKILKKIGFLDVTSKFQNIYLETSKRHKRFASSFQ